VALLSDGLHERTLILAPVVIAELFSNPNFSPQQRLMIGSLPVAEIKLGYWERAGRTRAELLRRKFHPKLADALIAQSCIDADMPLLSRDRDFAPFARHAGLKLIFPVSST
jgi:predicted nucleic acid-binding protein